MPEWPTKQQFSDFLHRLNPLETKAGQDAPWAYIDHFDHDGIGQWTSYQAFGNPIAMRVSGTDYSGILRLSGDESSGLTAWLTYLVAINLFVEIEVRFRAVSGSTFALSAPTTSGRSLAWNIASDGSASTLQEYKTIQPSTPDVWHTWRIIVAPNRLTLIRSDGPTSELAISTGDADQHGGITLQGQSNSHNPFQVDVDYFAWRPLPEAPIPLPPMIDA